MACTLTTLKVMMEVSKFVPRRTNMEWSFIEHSSESRLLVGEIVALHSPNISGGARPFSKDLRRK